MSAVLDCKTVMNAARQAAGLDDFGELPFEEALSTLLDYAQSDLQFSAAGQVAFEANIRRWLVNRLRYVDAVKRHPEILDEDLSDPIIVLGMPRCGTTKMQRLLSSAPGTLALPLWMALNPAPFPGEIPGQPEERIAFARAIQAAQQENNPDFLASHERTAEEAEEDSELLLFAIDYLMVYIIHPSDRLLDWLRARPSLPAYQFQHRLLQFLQWQQGGKQGRRWILKNPGHIGQMDALSTVYPNATLVHLHRDLRQVLPSYCRLIQSIYQELFEAVDPELIGRQTLAHWGPEFCRQAQQRAALADQLNIIDVPYRAVLDDALAVAAQAFERAGVAFTADIEQAMRAWQQSNAQHKHGSPEYSMAQYALTDDDILAAFGTFDDAIPDPGEVESMAL